MARRSNFDDSMLQRALVALREEMSREAMRGVRVAAVAFVETAKKRTKLAAKARIRRDYEKNAFAIEAERLGPSASGREIFRAVKRETAKRYQAIGYQRNGWKITRVRRWVVEIANTARNSRFVKNTVRAGRYAARDILKRIPNLVGRRLRPVARKYSAL